MAKPAEMHRLVGPVNLLAGVDLKSEVLKAPARYARVLRQAERFKQYPVEVQRSPAIGDGQVYVLDPTPGHAACERSAR